MFESRALRRCQVANTNKFDTIGEVDRWNSQKTMMISISLHTLASNIYHTQPLFIPLLALTFLSLPLSLTLNP